MRLTSIFVAFFAVSVLLAGFWLVTGNFQSYLPNVTAPQLEEALDRPTSFEPVSFSPPAVTAVESSAQKNLMASVSEELGKNILAHNPDGPTTIEEKQWVDVVGPETISDTLAQQALKNFSPEDFLPNINPSTLKISARSDAIVETAYLRAFHDILNHYFQDSKINFTDGALVNSDAILANYQQALAAFYQLEVPESLLFIHQKEISLLTGQRHLMETLASAQTDPMKAFLALQFFEKLTDEFTVLQNTITRFVTDHRLTIS